MLLLKRIVRKPGLALLAVLSMALPIGFLNSIPLFSRAVDRVVLREELARHSLSAKQPPFGVRVYAYGTPLVPLSYETVTSALGTIARTVSSQIGLPVLRSEVGASSINFTAETPKVLARLSQGGRPTHINFTAQPGLATRISTVSGSAYGEASHGAGDSVEVWLREELADRLLVQVGDEFSCVADQRLEEKPTDVIETLILDPVTVRVAGIWRPVLAADDASGSAAPWFGNPETVLLQSLLVTPSDYARQIEPRQLVKTHRATWDLVLDINATDPDEARAYLSGLKRALSLTQQSIPSALYDRAPFEPLRDYNTRDRVLSAQLLSYSIPGLGFLLFFLALTAALVARGHAHDTQVLLSRGMTTSGLARATALEGVLLSIGAVPLGISLAVTLARWMGHASGFLVFQTTTAYPVALKDLSPSLSAVAVAISLAFRLAATLRHARAPVAELNRQRARPLLAPAWMRYGVDLLLLAPTLYLTRQLTRAGTLAALAPLHGEDLYASIELILVPALFIATTSLLSIRLFPLVAQALGSIARSARSPTWLLAMRHLSRRWQAYTTPVLLVTVALSLGSYTLSLATSLDVWLVDRTYYRVGADLAFSPYLDLPPAAPGTAASRPIGGSWIPPVEEFVAIPGIRDATRVGRYRARIATPVAAAGEGTPGHLLAVDRSDFGRVAWFRSDLCSSSLGHLMNQLASSPDAVLVPESYLDGAFVRVGDELQASVVLDPEIVVLGDFTIAGTYDHFPTVYPEGGPTLIGNLAYVAGIGGIVPEHDIIAVADGAAPGREVFEAVELTGVEAGSRADAQALITQARARHEYVGVAGTLSIGCLASIGLAVLALLVYRQAALQDRVWWMSVLHALGTSRGELLVALILEQAVLLLYCGGVTLALGLWASRLYVPLMRIADGSQSLLPPLIPIVASRQAQILIGSVLSLSGLAEVALVLRTFRRSRFAALRVFQ